MCEESGWKDRGKLSSRENEEEKTSCLSQGGKPYERQTPLFPGSEASPSLKISGKSESCTGSAAIGISRGRESFKQA
jgi:hypothetical protein